MTLLDNDLDKIPFVRKLEILSLAHVTVARALGNIAKTYRLNTAECNHLGRDALYFSYGAPYYRKTQAPTQDQLAFPIIFMFDPTLVYEMDRFYPFDSGALCTGLYGSAWKDRFPVDQYYITSEPTRLVSCFYGGNEQYLAGRISPECDASGELLALHTFLKADGTRWGADRRHRTIECVSFSGLDIRQFIIWVAFPDDRAAAIGALWDACERKFDYYSYSTHEIEYPSDLIAVARTKAAERFGFLHRSPGAQR